ncbi:MAG: efflux RND transporter permease subunit [Phycisphaerales bacterium]|nr:efflux RND transporter permease subunit [Phycisphaerales bacterium]
MKAIEVGLKNPYLVVVVVLAVIVVGLVAMERLPADLLPQFDTPAVQIVTFYPGMPPEVMERDIMSRLQRWTGQSVGIDHQEAKAMLGVCVVKDFFREDISFDTAMSQVTSYAMSDMFYLPPGTIPPMVMPFDPTASVPLCLVSVSSPTMSEKDLYDVAYRELRNRLQSIQGVIAPAVYGGVLRRILAYVDPMELEARGLSPMDIVKTLEDQSVFIPTGNAKFGDTDYQIISNAMPERVEQLNEIPIKTESGAVVFMRDVGEVKDSHQIQSNIVNINGRRQAYIPIYRQPGANTIEITAAIKNKLAEILARLREMDPRAKDMSLEVVMDQSELVKKSIGGLQVAAGLGALLAGAVVFLFLRSVRSTIVIMFAIPLAILAALIGLFYTGDTINSMTLGGLALAIGILVDQSIVVLDNITRHIQMGKKRTQAALDGTREVALPVLVSTITFAVVFFPVVFLTGMAKFLFQPLAVTVVMAVAASYIVAMFVIPSFCARFLSEKHAKEPNQEKSGVEIPVWFGSLFDKVIRARHVVVLVSFVLLLVAGLLMWQSGTELFPSVDSNQFTIYVRMPSGTRIENTEATVNQIEQVIIEELGQPDPEFPKVEKHPDSKMRILISNIGVLMDWPAAYTPNAGPMDAFVLVQLKSDDKPGRPGTFEAVDRLREKLSVEFPGVELAFDTGGMMTAALNFGLPSPINIQIQGSNLFTGEEIARHVQRIASGVPGAIDVRVAQRMDYPQIGVEVDRVKAAQLGLVQDDVIKNIVTATNSSIGFNPAFWIAPENKNHYFIGAQYSEEGITSMETLRNVPITGSNSEQPVPLRNIAEFYRATGPSVVNHVNITRTIDIYANVARGHDVGSVASEIERELGSSDVLGLEPASSDRGVTYKVTGDYAGKGYTLGIRGEVETMRSSFGEFAFGLIIAVILVYLAMVAQLRSFSTPMIILVSIPLAFVGVAALLFVTGTNLNIPAFMGIIMVTGIVVEYAIILLDFSNQRVQSGQPVKQAIKEATWIRLRPILMTSMTTWLALVPMAIGAAGGEANAPLARTIIGGVLAATALSLIVVPCLYVMFRRGDDPMPSTVPAGA